jgi:hypothetical protein
MWRVTALPRHRCVYPPAGWIGDDEWRLRGNFPRSSIVAITAGERAVSCQLLEGIEQQASIFNCRRSHLQRSGTQDRTTPPRIPRERALAQLHWPALGEQPAAMLQDPEMTKFDR